MDVLQSNLTAGDELVALRLADLDLPELLRATLVDGHGHHPEAPTSVRTQEVGGVGDSNGLEPAVPDRLVGPKRREGLDHGGVEPAVHDAPGLVVAFVGGHRTADAGARALVELDVEKGHELAGPGVTRHHKPKDRADTPRRRPS